MSKPKRDTGCFCDCDYLEASGPYEFYDADEIDTWLRDEVVPVLRWVAALDLEPSELAEVDALLKEIEG